MFLLLGLLACAFALEKPLFLPANPIKVSHPFNYPSTALRRRVPLLIHRILVLRSLGNFSFHSIKPSRNPKSTWISYTRKNQ